MLSEHSIILTKCTPGWRGCKIWPVLHGGGGPQIGEVTFDGSRHLSYKRDHIKMRHYMDRRVTQPKPVTSPTWGPLPSCKQALREGYFFTLPKRVTSPTWGTPLPCKGVVDYL